MNKPKSGVTEREKKAPGATKKAVAPGPPVSSGARKTVKKVTKSKSGIDSFQIALVILVIAFLVQAVSTCYFSFLDKKYADEELSKTIAAVEKSEKARRQLDAIGGKTAMLAERGNKNAVAVIQQFKAAGVNIKSPEQ